MSQRTPSTNTLFYGDNLRILRDQIESESVDLVYLDPPFNSNANYNVLFRSPTGEQSQAQIEAFGDTWHWNEAANRAFDEVMTSGNSDAAEMLRAMKSFLKENDMMAYLTMMTVRLLELHRVLKPTGSLYLHCDPTASHYLRILLDSVFGKDELLGELIWKRTNARGTQGRWPRLHDSILHFGKTKHHKHNVQLVPAEINKQPHTLITGFDGQRYQTFELTGAGTRRGETGQPWRDFDPTKFGRHWGNLHAQLNEWDELGLIHWPKGGGFPRRKADVPFAVASRQIVVGDVWTDVDRINQSAQERLGYPTQKPIALLERIICASSNEGDLVLDPFCGCGTTVHAAQKLNRRWIGIDVTHLAVGLVKRRLVDAFPMARFDVQGVPKDLGGAKALSDQDKHQFQLWALSLVEAQPYKGGRKGGDQGIDGYLYFKPDGRTTEKAVVSVKGGAHVGPTMIRDLVGTVDAEKAKMGFFITLEDPTVRMRQAASAAGLYKTDYGTFEKIQILTIEELLDGRRPHMPWIDPSAFKKAKREASGSQGKLEI